MVALPLQIIRAHIVPDATEAGMSEASAAFVLTAMGASVTAFRIGLGRVSDEIGNRATYFTCLVLQFGALFALAVAVFMLRGYRHPQYDEQG